MSVTFILLFAFVGYFMLLIGNACLRDADLEDHVDNKRTLKRLAYAAYILTAVNAWAIYKIIAALIR